MKTKKEILSFIENEAMNYSIELRIFFPNERFREENFDVNTIELSEENLCKLSNIFGCKKEDITNANTEVVGRWLKKYSYFKEYSMYKFMREMPYDGVDNLLSGLFGKNYKRRTKKPYNSEDIANRIVDNLQSMEKCVPGTIHEGATIDKLGVEYYYMRRDPEIRQLTRLYMDINNRYKELFFKAIRCKLSDDEISEYNVLAAHLLAVDVINTNEHMFYDYIERNRTMFVAENYHELFSYTRLRMDDFDMFAPYECVEFYDDIALVKEYVKAFPRTKSRMVEYEEKVSNYICSFIWSDDPIEVIEDYECPEKDDFSCMEIPKYVFVNVKKNEIELDKSANAINILRELVKLPTVGGLKLEHSDEFDVRMNDFHGAMDEVQYYNKRLDFRKAYKIS